MKEKQRIYGYTSGEDGLIAGLSDTGALIGAVPVFVRAAVFADERASKTVYDLVSSEAGQSPYTLSSYRYLDINQPHKQWVVAIVGEPPSRAFRRRVDRLLDSGDSYELTPDELDHFMTRLMEHHQERLSE